MTNSIEIATAQNIDGIEMYCSNDGSKTGMSTRGLVRFTGIPRTTLRRLLLAITGADQMPGDAKHIEIPKALQCLNSSNLYVEAIFSKPVGDAGQDDGKIISSYACAIITNWAASSEGRNSEVAKYSALKFLENGMSNFIKEATGYQQQSASLDTQAILASLSILTAGMAELKTEMVEVKTELSTTNGYRKVRATYPGLEQWMQSIPEDDSLLSLAPAKDDKALYTISEAMAELYPHIELTTSVKISLGMMVAATYKSMRHEAPPRVQRLNDKGQKLPIVSAYPEEMLPVVKGCFVEFVATSKRSYT